MKCLIIDNYDSFTWNLGDYVSQVFGREPLIVRNDEFTWPELNEPGRFDAIIISPGPGTVSNPADFHVSRDALLQETLPVLGVCLGFQGLAHEYGGKVLHAPVPYHGRSSRIRHAGNDLFAGIPDGFEAVRYHSLMVDPHSLPNCLSGTAYSECGLLMALRHVSQPKWGIQFHPESILTQFGKRIILNFRDMAAKHLGIDPELRATTVAVPVDLRGTDRLHKERKRVVIRPLTADTTAESAFLRLYADKRNAFWLDSQRVIRHMSRYSFMGAVDDAAISSCSANHDDAVERSRLHFEGIEHTLESIEIEGGEELPFEFRGGFVGFLTYEAKAFLGERTRHRNAYPDSVWMQVDRFLAFDHVEGRAWAVAVSTVDDSPEANAWLAETCAQLEARGKPPARPRCLGLDHLDVRVAQSMSEYLDSIDKCKREIVDGESYEVCLTNSFSFEADLDPLDLYLTMRTENAAPFGAYLRVGGVAMLSTSPERFFMVKQDGVVQSKPIKGTCARGADPESDRQAAERLACSEKDRAENLMIVDLMRNDLSRVSRPGSICVPKLMDIESYTTVHQMVSTVESRLKDDCTLIDLLTAVIPGGSITGAPKIRTMEIIDRLESVPRGIYCGSIGYLGYGRVADLNIAIRTLSYDGKTVRLGAGGAVTFLSDPKGEFDEVLLKAEAVLKPVWHYVNHPASRFEYTLSGNALQLRQATLAEQAV